jgi:hypothetical protein
MIIGGFNESGNYSFYSAKGADKSLTMTLFFLSISSEKYVSQLKSYVSSFIDDGYAESVFSTIQKEMEKGYESLKKEKEDAISAVKRKVDEKSIHEDDAKAAIKNYELQYLHDMRVSPTPLEIACDMYSKIKDLQAFEISTYSQIFQVFERYAYLQAISMNMDNRCDISITSDAAPLLTVGAMVTKIVLEKVTSRGVIPYKTIEVPCSGRYILRFGVDRSYRILLYSDNEMVCTMNHYQMDEACLSYLWTEEKTLSDEIEQAMSDDMMYDNTGIEMTHEEKEYAIAEKKKGAFDCICCRPRLDHIHWNKMYFYIDEYEMLNALGKKFYLAGKESDLLFTANNERNSEITNEYASIDCKENYLDGNILFYVIDGSHRIVSKVTRYSYDEDLSEYNYKLRNVEIDAYNQRIQNILKVQAPYAKNTVEKLLDNARGDETISVDGLWKYLISSISGDNSFTEDKIKVYHALLEDLSVNSTCDADFFDSGVLYSHATDIYAFPGKKKPYALAVYAFNDSDSTIHSWFYPSFNASIDIQARQYDCYIMFAIDSETYKRSGFILAKTNKKDHRIYNYNIGIEMS